MSDQTTRRADAIARLGGVDNYLLSETFRILRERSGRIVESGDTICGSIATAAIIDLAEIALAEPSRVDSLMLSRWRARRERCLSGVTPTLAELEAAMPRWTTEVVTQEAAPAGSAMRRAIDAGQHVIGMLWKHSEALRERIDLATEKADAVLAAPDSDGAALRDDDIVVLTSSEVDDFPSEVSVRHMPSGLLVASRNETTMAGNLAKAKSALCAALAASNANTRGGE